MMKKKTMRDNPYGVDAPMTRMALALIYLSTGLLPKGLDDTWRDKLGGTRREEPTDASGGQDTTSDDAV